jgi:hypothetical protein
MSDARAEPGHLVPVPQPCAEAAPVSWLRTLRWRADRGTIGWRGERKMNVPKTKPGGDSGRRLINAASPSPRSRRANNNLWWRCLRRLFTFRLMETKPSAKHGGSWPLERPDLARMIVEAAR